jgi:SagB-type dehydrogenase family enzyme
LSQSLFLCLRDGVSASSPIEAAFVVTSATVRLVFEQVAPGTVAALQRLASSGDHEDRLAEFVCRTDGPAALAKFYLYLHRLTQRRLLVRLARDDGETLASVVPVSSHFIFGCRQVSADQQYVLSRFAYARREGHELVLESPLSHGRVVLHDARAGALVQALARARPAKAFAGLVPGLSAEAADMVTALLLNSGMVQELNRLGQASEEESNALQCWEFHDLLFHARSRAGRQDSAIGGTYRLAGRLAPLPALKPMQPGESIELHHPDLDQLLREDPPFAWVHETRRSMREYAPAPITARELGEFLCRVGRVKEQAEVEVATPHGPVRLGLASRPYPSGGALHELELYCAISACQDIAPGLYYYDALNHRLCRLSGHTRELQQLLRDASFSAQIPLERLQVLLIVAARFPRIGWKYAGLAYSLILKNVGVIYQSMYLAATAMGLAPCALGCGDADLFARAAGTDYYAETSVGEFLLGGKQ